MINVLVTGKDSQLAKCIKEISSNYPKILFRFKNSEELDITDKVAIENQLNKANFDYCINCAAYTAVDKAESEPQKAYEVNTIGAKNLAVACKMHNVILIHISTDFVFNGEGELPYLETNDTNPLGVYGKSKRDGEIEIAKANIKHFIIRTSWLYSVYGNNFLKTMLKLSKTEKEIRVVNDQIGSPTYAPDLAIFICNVIESKIEKYGIYHFSNIGKISWFGFAKEIFKLWNIDLELKPITSSEFLTAARRPKYSVLNISKAHKTFKLAFQSWKSALSELSSKKNMF